MKGKPITTDVELSDMYETHKKKKMIMLWQASKWSTLSRVFRH